MSISYPVSENDNRTVLDYENTSLAHDYAEKKFPREYQERNCLSGQHNKEYWFIHDIVEAYKSGLEKMQNGK